MTRILIVDDDQDIAKILRFRLERKGYDCVTAYNGIEALDILDHTHPDLILLDVMMPKMDGFTTCREIRKRNAWTRIPVIMLTARVGTSDKVNGISEGADDYITKPFEFDELLARIQMILRRTLENMSANPLTGLPGNRVITRQIEAAIAANTAFAACHADVDHFKAYNDEYGFEAGDHVIKQVAEMIAGVLRDTARTAFLGHVGGDDFFFLVDLETYAACCEEILRRFDAAAPGFYTEAHRALGYIEAQSRQGEKVRYPIMTLSIGVVTTAHRTFSDAMQVANLAGEMKKFAKGASGSVYRVDRRAIEAGAEAAPPEQSAGGERAAGGSGR